MTTRQEVEAEARELQAWITAMRVGPAQLPGSSAAQRASRARDLTRASGTLMRGAIAEALELESPAEAAHLLGTVRAFTRLRQWESLRAGATLDDAENNGLWTALFQLQRATGDVLPAQTHPVDVRPIRPHAAPRSSAPRAPREAASTNVGTGVGALGFALLLLVGLRFRPRR